jgi:hypothetical protein
MTHKILPLRKEDDKNGTTRYPSKRSTPRYPEGLSFLDNVSHCVSSFVFVQELNLLGSRVLYFCRFGSVLSRHLRSAGVDRTPYRLSRATGSREVNTSCTCTRSTCMYLLLLVRYKYNHPLLIINNLSLSINIIEHVDNTFSSRRSLPRGA